MLVEKVVEAGDYRVRYQIVPSDADPDRTRPPPKAAVDIVIIGEALIPPQCGTLWERRFQQVSPPTMLCSELPVVILQDSIAIIGVFETVYGLEVPAGTEAWSSQLGNTEIKKIVRAESNNQHAALVLHKYYQHQKSQGFNLYRLSSCGKVDWRAELYHSSDVYVDFTLQSDATLSAQSWNGLSCKIALDSGRILAHRPTK